MIENYQKLRDEESGVGGGLKKVLLFKGIFSKKKQFESM